MKIIFRNSARAKPPRKLLTCVFWLFLLKKNKQNSGFLNYFVERNKNELLKVAFGVHRLASSEFDALHVDQHVEIIARVLEMIPVDVAQHSPEDSNQILSCYEEDLD